MNESGDKWVVKKEMETKMCAYVFWFDINVFGVVENQHFPQCLQINAIIWRKLDSFIGPGHWLGDKRSHYPLQKKWCDSKNPRHYAHKIEMLADRDSALDYQLSVSTDCDPQTFSFFNFRLVHTSWCFQKRNMKCSTLFQI